MKKHLAFLCLIISGGLASATTQNKADPDKPATVEITSGKVLKTGKWLGDVQLTWKYDTHWTKGGGGSVENRNGESGPKGDAFVHGDIYTIDGKGIATAGNFFYEGHDCSDPANDDSGGNPLSDDRLGWQISLPMLKGSLVDGADIDYGCEWPDDWTSIFYENDAADCTVTLHTGGKSSVQKQNLFAISGSATQITCPVNYGFGGDNIDGVGLWSEGDFTASGNVPPTSIQVPGVGKSLGSDGNLYCALPDNADIDVTLQAPVVYYSFSVSAQKYKLHILANDYPLADDRVRPQAYYCVGQKLNFQAVFSPSLPDSTSVSPIWNYTADYINNHWTDANGCEEYNIAPIPAMSNPTTAWFYNQQTQDANANVGFYCTFANGQTAYVIGKGQFNVFTPTVTVSDIRPRHFRLASEVVAYLLGLGESDDIGAMVYQVNYNTETPFSGTGRITQLCMLNYSGIHVPSCSFSDYRLDGSEAYEEDVIIPNTAKISLTLQDGPYNIDTLPNTLQGSFQDYIRYRPNAGSAGDNIFVTLGIVSWSMNATAINSTIISPSQTPDPTGPDNSNNFPLWTNTH